MKKQKTLNNKGFSLVELIIVIAIMAILVGVLAPSLLRYVEKTNVSADTQLADAVRTAVITAMMDPAVINANETPSSAAAFIDAHDDAAGGILSASLSGAFKAAVNETLGLKEADDTHAKMLEKLKSTHKKAAVDGTGGSQIMVYITSGNSVKVVITETDNTGKKTPAADKFITVE